MSFHAVNTSIRLRVTFVDTDGVPTDPTTVTLTVTDPAGTATVYTDSVNDPAGVGLFYKDITPASVGLWTYKFVGTGGISATIIGSFMVAALEAIPDGIPTLGTLIEWVRLAARDQPPYDTVSGAYTTTTTAITFADGTAFPVNTRFDWYDTTFEASLVTAKSSATAGTIVRGIVGTTAANHSTGAQVIAKPRYLLTQYRLAINNALRAIGTQFRRRRWDTSSSFSSTKRLLPVPADATAIFAVAEKPTSDTTLWPVAAVLEPVLPTSLTSTGKAIRLLSYNPGTGTAYIGYESPWTELVNWTDTLDAGFPVEALDLIVEGAIRYLENPDIFARLAFTKPHVLGSGSPAVQTGELLTAARLQMATFLQRRQELAASQPPNFGWVKG